MKAFFELFENTTSLKKEFDISDKELEGVRILVAVYEYGNWEGAAFVLFERDGKLYEVHAAHCSCYGLEGQWAPEETTHAALLMRKPYDFAALWPTVLRRAKAAEKRFAQQKVSA